MQGKEKLIGLILGVVISLAAGALGLQSDEIKAGLCGAPPALAAPAK